VYLSDKYANTPATQASKLMLTTSGVKLTQMRPEMETLELNYKVEK